MEKANSNEVQNMDTRLYNITDVDKIEAIIGL